jgi:hypothetical protein
LLIRSANSAFIKIILLSALFVSQPFRKIPLDKELIVQCNVHVVTTSFHDPSAVPMFQSGEAFVSHAIPSTSEIVISTYETLRSAGADEWTACDGALEAFRKRHPEASADLANTFIADVLRDHHARH